MTKHPRPAVVPLADVAPVPAGEAPTRVRIRRIVTRAEHGSELTQGVCWMDPGEQTNTWSSHETDDTSPDEHWYGPVHETYYIVTGTLRLSWDDDAAVLHAGDTVYLAPGWRYHLENIGEEQAFFVYNMTPAQE